MFNLNHECIVLQTEYRITGVPDYYSALASAQETNTSVDS